MKVLDLDITNLLIFKNGVVQVVKELSLSQISDPHRFLIRRPPYALQGSFWVRIEPEEDLGDDEATKLPKVVSVREVKYTPPIPPPTRRVPCASWSDFLHSNVGASLRLVLNLSSSASSYTTLEGILESCSESIFVIRQTAPESEGKRTILMYSQVLMVDFVEEGHEIVLDRLETENEVRRREAGIGIDDRILLGSEQPSSDARNMNSNSFLEVLLEGVEEEEEEGESEEEERTSGSGGISRKRGKVVVSYVSKDLCWFPCYKLDLNVARGQATLCLQATLNILHADFGGAKKSHHHLLGPLNTPSEKGDSEEGENDENLGVTIRKLFLAGGNPKLGYDSSPERLLSDTVPTQARSGRGRGVPGNFSNRNKLMNPVFDNRLNEANFVVAAGPDDAPETIRDGKDFLIYSLEAVRLAPRSLVSVLNLPGLRFSEAYIVALRESSDPLPVQHIGRLENSSAFPWTAGPVIVSSTSQLLVAQTDLKFTPCGQTAELELDTSLSVRVNYRTALKTSRVAKKGRKSSLMRVVTSGFATFSNTRSEPATVLATLTVEGKLMTTTVECSSKTERLTGSTATQASYALDGGPGCLYTDLEWRLNLEAGEKKEVEITIAKVIRVSHVEL